MRNIAYLLTLSVVVSLCAGCPCGKPGDPRFTSANQSGGGWWGLLDGILAPMGAEDNEGAGEQEQPREVVEPDVIRRDGNLLYVLNQYRGLTIADLDSEVLLSQVATTGFPRDLYLVGDRAYVLVGYAHQFMPMAEGVQFEVSSRLYVLDVSNPAEAAILASFDLEGDLVDSRLVGDVLYAVSAQFEWYWDGVAVAKEQTSESWVTQRRRGGPREHRRGGRTELPRLWPRDPGHLVGHLRGGAGLEHG